VQGHDEASPTAPTKAIKRPKKVKASRHTSDASGGGTVEGVLCCCLLRVHLT
jgi:hypothetical protein